ncbi:hypothetical protein H8959_005021 [Pygathrix nigripes]
MIYNDHNKIIQEKLQEFTQKMAKISHLETELKQVCHSVETVYKDLCLQPEKSSPLPTVLSPAALAQPVTANLGFFFTPEPKTQTGARSL